MGGQISRTRGVPCAARFFTFVQNDGTFGVGGVGRSFRANRLGRDPGAALRLPQARVGRPLRGLRNWENVTKRRPLRGLRAE